MITRQTLQHLQSIVAIPALSILVPTHRAFPENKQDPILVKNLVDEAKQRLGEEFAARDIEPVFKRLDELVNAIDYNHTLDGLALYVSHDFAASYILPFAIPARVIIDKTFATRDLVYGMHREQSFWMLLLSQASTRLISGFGETLEEIQDKNFPMQMTGPAATAPIPYHADSSYADDRHRRFFQQVDAAFSEYIEPNETPILIVGGVDRQISFFQEVSQYAPAIAGKITGNFDKTAVHELTPEVMSIVALVRQTQRQEALQLLAEAMDTRKVVFTLEEAWQLAQEGRGQMLLVEKNYRVPAVLTASGGLQMVDEPGGTDVMDDAIDELIEAVLAKGGRIIKVEDGALTAEQQVALILRY